MLYISFNRTPYRIETIRATLEQAGKSPRNDDRDWLWKANLAIRTHSYEEAAWWLDLCLKKRPNDAAVWRPGWIGPWRLIASECAGSPRAFVRGRIQFGSKVQKLAAWFAATAWGDHDSERTCLQLVLAADPADIAAMDRLISLLGNSGVTDDADRLRSGRTTSEQANTMGLQVVTNPAATRPEMGRLAEHLGHRFEARGIPSPSLLPRRPSVLIFGAISPGSLKAINPPAPHSARTRCRSARTLRPRAANSRDTTDSIDGGSRRAACISRRAWVVVYSSFAGGAVGGGQDSTPTAPVVLGLLQGVTHLSNLDSHIHVRFRRRQIF